VNTCTDFGFGNKLLVADMLIDLNLIREALEKIMPHKESYLTNEWFSIEFTHLIIKAQNRDKTLDFKDFLDERKKIIFSISQNKNNLIYQMVTLLTPESNVFKIIIIGRILS
jgi:hypothetical protein